MHDLSRRSFLGSGAAAGLVVVTGSLPGAPAEAVVRRPFIPYGRRSYFKSQAKDFRIRPVRTRRFREFMRTHPDQRDYAYPRINGVDGNEWGQPYAMGRARHPLWRLTGEEPHPKARRLYRRGFHAPEWIGSMLTGTSDSPLCVIDRAFGFTMWCADAEVVGDHLIKATAASITYHDSNGLDYRNPRSNDERNYMSRGRISEAMVIRRDLMRYAVRNDTDLGHVLQMFLVETRSADGHRHPMVGEEDGKHGFGAQGERIAIAPWVDLRKRGLSPEGLVIARTLKRHGCYFGDNSGSESTLLAQQENSKRPIWDGRLDRDALKGITWDDFVVLGRRKR